MIKATHDALVLLGLVDDTPLPPPSPIILEEVFHSPPGTPPQQVHGTPPQQVHGTPPQQVHGTPRRPPPVRREEIVQQRLEDDVAREELQRQLHYGNDAETPSRDPVWMILANYPIQDLIGPLFQ